MIEAPVLEEMQALTKTYSSGNSVTLYSSISATRTRIDEVEPKFFKAKHGKWPSETFYRSGFVVSSTDVHAMGGKVRRRAAFILLWSPNDERWMTWSIGSVKSVTQGKRLIDNILKTGILPE